MKSTTKKSFLPSETIYYSFGECALGTFLLGLSNSGICAITLSNDRAKLIADLQNRFPTANLIFDEQHCQALIAQTTAYIENPNTTCPLPLDIRGSAFQQTVWQTLRTIAFGKTATYTEIAATIGKPKAVRAVANACGANAIAVLIPCHRIIRNDGSLSGYRWGIEYKQALLSRENTLPK